MKMDRAILIAALLLIGAWGIAATDDPVKIGFVDVEQVLAVSDGGKAAREELERKSREAQARLAPIVEQLEALQKEHQAKKFVMSEDAARAMELDMIELQNNYKSRGEQEEGQFKIDQQRLLSPLIEKLESVIDEVGRENDFSLIVRADDPSFIYKREALDITDLVIKNFNRKG
jgi:outer membrane protein